MDYSREMPEFSKNWIFGVDKGNSERNGRRLKSWMLKGGTLVTILICIARLISEKSLEIYEIRMDSIERTKIGTYG